MNVEKKPQKCMCVSNLYSKPEMTSWSLTLQLDTIIIEVSSVKGLSLRGNTLQGQTLAINNWTYGDTGFHIG